MAAASGKAWCMAGFTRQSSGHVKIGSEVGQGTVVKLYLPQTSSWRPGERDGALPESEVGGSEHILLVEDDDLVRRHGLNLLTGPRYEVVTARNGQVAARRCV
jgi:hypothetical protein